MEFITTHMIWNWKSHIVWGLFYCETTSIFFQTIIFKNPNFGRTYFLICEECWSHGSLDNERDIPIQ